jgi:hypothetical protein
MCVWNKYVEAAKLRTQLRMSLRVQLLQKRFIYTMHLVVSIKNNEPSYLLANTWGRAPVSILLPP